MALHAAAMMAFFVDQAQQTPMQIQCVQQATPDSWLKWLLPTIVQTVISLASIAAGVLIAVVSFRKNKKTEHEQWLRNQKAGHEQWVRDQAKAEWSAILSRLTAADVKLPHVFNNLEWFTMSEGMLQEIRDVLPAMRNAIFVRDVLEQEKVMEGFRDFVSEAAKKIKQIKDFTDNISRVPGAVSLSELGDLNKEQIKQIAEREIAYSELYRGFHVQADKIRETAIDALTSSGTIVDQGPSVAGRVPHA